MKYIHIHVHLHVHVDRGGRMNECYYNDNGMIFSLSKKTPNSDQLKHLILTLWSQDQEGLPNSAHLTPPL